MRRFVAPALAALVLTATALAAQAQGTVNALCSTDAGWCEAAAAEFSRATGIRVLQAHKGTGEIGAQLRAEAANPKTDIWWGGTGDPFLQAAEEGLLEPYRPAYINDLYDWSVRQYAMSGNRVGGFYTSAMGFGFNTEVLKKKHLPEPRCWADLVKPEYKGEIEMSHPATSGTGYTIVAGLVQLMGEDAAFDYLKKLHRNTTTYTRSGQAQAPNVAKGEVAVGISFIFGFDKWRQDKYPVKSAAPCEGTGYEIGGIALVKGARNKANAQRYYDWLMSPAGQAIGAQAGSLQSPANRTFKPDPRIPSMDGVKLIKYDFEKYGQAAERKRLIDRWTREVESQPR
ncbi:ABC transporter substrate-binding protein [Variovorax sp. J31P207]|uniref:ABC transporter substrate-binding protein n=1 Tax=Variovorax sp. J31P207 TaxID=3053510 RepID=UPI0025761426|nr:ABC transporter substrate-binding protein [Variovorax sp. J31P207]MDM0067587.1 ABC transporter substrate-binding protein [Variovorax sp. J31P207]